MDSVKFGSWVAVGSETMASRMERGLINVINEGDDPVREITHWLPYVCMFPGASYFALDEAT